MASQRTTGPETSVDTLLAWAVVGVLAVATGHLALAGDLLWTGLATTVLAASVLPLAVTGRPQALVTWEVLGVAALPVGARALGLGGEAAGAMTVPALALVVAVELDQLTDVRMSPRFAIGFVVVVTMALAGSWTVVQFVADAALGTTLLGRQRAVMWEIVTISSAGVVAGCLFELYVRRYRVADRPADSGGNTP